MNVRIANLILVFVCFLMSYSSAQDGVLPIPFEQNENQTATYQEGIAFYESLAEVSEQVEMKAWGSTDIGLPIHTVVFSSDGTFDPTAIRKNGKLVMLVNNAIHPGEPCGVDASMMLLRDIVMAEKYAKELKDIVIVVIPFYNIGGVLNRGAYSRANQNGPMQYGFRGNSQNLDLNRDFIKCDTRNAQTFNQIYHHWSPDVFVDNHTSNGADYQYTITLIATQHNKLDPHLAEYMQQQMLPQLYAKMEAKSWEMTPYVYARNTPDNGIAGFLDLARYSSGYAAIHNAISFMPETHMLKPFKDRVQSTYSFMTSVIETMATDKKAIQKARKKAIKNTKEKASFDIGWTLDMKRADTIFFKGYSAEYQTSAVSSLQRLHYDRNRPYEKKIPHWNYYKTTQSVEKPEAYIIPQAYHEVIERLEWNGVKVERLKEDIDVEVEMYRIEDYETTSYPYEKHYLHSKVELSTKKQTWKYHKGDYVVYVDQTSNRYIVETLEPHAPDSYFAWNFFDGILMQKEHFSAYVFEDIAADILNDNKELRKELEKKKREDEKFANSARAQLDFVYKNSPYYEPTHKLYPVGRLLKKTKLLLE